MLTKAFWALVALTAALVVLITLGYTLLPALAVMLIVDILAIEAMRRGDMKTITNDLAHTIAARFDSLEKVCNGIASSVTASRDDILVALGKAPPQPQPEPTEAAEAVVEPAEIEEKKAEDAPAAAFSVDYGGQD